MIKFDKKDIYVLDFIIDKCLENAFEPVLYIDLINAGFLVKKKEKEGLILRGCLRQYWV